MTRRAKITAGMGLAIAIAAAAAWIAIRPMESGPVAGGERFRSPVGGVPAIEQRPGDASAGYDTLVNAPYVSCGMPRDAYRRLNPDVPAEDVLPDRDARNADLPYMLTSHVNADGVEVVANNCLTCHAARIEGELIIGLGNEFADFTQDPGRLTLRAGNYVRGAAETEAWSFWADRIAGIAPYVQTRTIGVNPAPNLTWALMAHLDPETLRWSAEPLIEPPPQDPLPISVPPWWGMGKKHAMFYTTIGRGDHARFMLLASMLCIDGLDEVSKIDSYAPDVRAYIASLEAPEFPYPIDTELAAEGEVVFRQECSDCHGTYGVEESYPNRVYPVGEVGTDPAYAMEATDGSRDRFYRWVQSSPYGDRETARPAPGYIAPPLDGVWATAPYLHNGSVPSMEALLSSSLRPTYWRHRSDPRRYDPDTLGWEYEVLEAGQDAEADPARRRSIYDTTLRGYGNEGHTYGNRLTDTARDALLEYLKSL